MNKQVCQPSDAPRPPTTSSSSAKRMSITFSHDTLQQLDFLASSQGISQSEVIRKSLATEAYLYQERLEGSKILLQKSDKELREVVFR